MAKKSNRTRRSSTGQFELAGAFPATSDEAWRALVQRILGDRDFDEALTRKTYDDITIEPLYTAKDWHPGEEASGFPGMAPFTRGHRVIGHTTSGWDIRQLHGHPDRSTCNKAILEDLGRGVTSIDLRFDRAGRRGRDSDDPEAAADVGVSGAMIACIDDLDEILDGVYLDACPVGVRAGAACLPAAGMMLALLARRGIASDAFAGALNADPLGALAEMGELATSAEDALGQLAALARHVVAAYPLATAVAVDTTCYHDAGASEAQELACAVATGAAYLRAMTAAGLDLDAAFGQIAFTFSTDANLFLSIAKLRAARKLWGRVAEACGMPTVMREMRLHAVTSERMLSRRDPWVNILRGTVAALAASVAGADSVTVLPFTAAIGIPDAGARRIARNTQLVLQQESSLSRVIDPAGGSWAIENLTDAMAREAWTLFQAIEKEGGMPAAIESGRLRDRIAAVAARRARQVAGLGDPLTGTSAFPNLAEQRVAVEQVDLPKLRRQASARLNRHRARAAKLPAVARLASLADVDAATLCEAIVGGAAAGASLHLLTDASGRANAARAVPLRRHRLSEDFEALRDASDAYLERTGKRPTVFLAAVGTLARYTTALAYARNFLATGGIDAIAGDGGTKVATIVRRFQSSGADVAVICSDEAGYHAVGPGLAAALADAGAREVYVVGRPAGKDGPFGPAGVKGFLYEGCDVLAQLNGMLQGMGISKG
jgi:methylmalonyl-CoA mutase